MLAKLVTSSSGAVVAYVNRSSLLVLIEVDLRNRLASDQMEIIPLAGNGTVVGIRCIRPRLVIRLQGDSTVEGTVRVAAVRLRLRGKANSIPTPEKVLCVGKTISMRLSGPASRWTMETSCGKITVCLLMIGYWKFEKLDSTGPLVPWTAGFLEMTSAYSSAISLDGGENVSLCIVGQESQYWGRERGRSNVD